MKQLIWKLVLPLTIISFTTFTKWWFCSVLGETVQLTMTGFPLPYQSFADDSGPYQIFVSSLILDIFTYFIFWLILIFLINRYVIKIKLNNAVAVCLIFISGFLLLFTFHDHSTFSHIYYWDRDFEIEVLETKYEFFGYELSSSK